jgi:hypothetical protein
MAIIAGHSSSGWLRDRQFAMHTLADLKEAWRHGVLWRQPSRNRVIRTIGLTLVFQSFCLFQFSSGAAAAKGYALVLLLSGAVWLVTSLIKE